VFLARSKPFKALSKNFKKKNNKLEVEKSSTKVKIRTDDFRNESSFSGRIDYRSRNCNLVS
jgi:hypothetical protein